MNQAELPPVGNINPENPAWPGPSGPELGDRSPEAQIRPSVAERPATPSPSPAPVVPDPSGLRTVSGSLSLQRRVFQHGSQRPQVGLPRRRLIETYTRQAQGVVETTRQTPAEQKRRLIPLMDGLQDRLKY